MSEQVQVKNGIVFCACALQQVVNAMLRVLLDEINHALRNC